MVLLMKFFYRGGIFYGLVYLIWRGPSRILSWLATMFYRRNLKACGIRTVFSNSVYLMYPKNVVMGSYCVIGPKVVITSEFPPGNLWIADHVQLSDGVRIDFSGSVKIGSRTLISSGASILSHDHGYDPRSDPYRCDLVIGENVWIGMNAIILPSAQYIGDNAIVGAGAVVTKPVQKDTIVVGNPAKIIGFVTRV